MKKPMIYSGFLVGGDIAMRKADWIILIFTLVLFAASLIFACVITIVH